MQVGRTFRAVLRGPSVTKPLQLANKCSHASRTSLRVQEYRRCDAAIIAATDIAGRKFSVFMQPTEVIEKCKVRPILYVFKNKVRNNVFVIY